MLDPYIAPNNITWMRYIYLSGNENVKIYCLASMNCKYTYTHIYTCVYIQKTKIMASGPTTSWEIDGETVETVSDFIFGGSKITVDGDCSHEIKNTGSLEEKLWPI